MTTNNAAAALKTSQDVRLRMICLLEKLQEVRGCGLTVADIADEAVGHTDGQVRYALNLLVKVGVVARVKQDCRSRCGRRAAWTYFVRA